jgi:hypothetical protein
MALIPRRNPLTSLLNFAADRDREANSLGSVITQLAGPALGQMGVQTEETAQPAVMRGPVPMARPLGAFTGPAMAPTPVDFNPRSTELLGAVDPRLRDVLTETEKRARERGIEIQVSETLRDKDRQADLVSQGKSQTMNSRHLTGNAADIFIQNPDGSANWDFEAYRPVAEIAKEVAAEKGYDDLVWGGDWKTLKDGVHFQMGGATVTGGGDATTAMGGAGADTLGGNSVEGLLAQLYPQMTPEEEKRQRRNDFFSAASQGLTALGQGRPVDFSNIRADQENRKRQAVLDMRERERARAASSLVYSQTGDAALATGIATGAISYGDVLSERQMKRAEQLADQQRIRDAESAEATAAAMKRTGLYNEEDIAAVAAGTLSADQLGSVYEQGQLAEQLRTETEAKAEVAAQNVVDAQMVLQSAAPGSTEARAAERVIALGGAENVYDIIKARTPASADTKVLGPNERLVSGTGEIIATGVETPGGVNEVADIAKANMLFEGGALNPATNQPFTSASEALAAIQFYKPSNAAAGGVSLNYDAATGNFSFTNAGGAAQGAAPAGGGVVEVAKPEAGTATVVQDGALTAVPLEGAIAPQQAQVDLATAEQALAERTAAAAPELEIKQLEAQVLRAEAAVLQANQTIDMATKEASLANIEADVQRKQAEIATLTADAEKQKTSEYTTASRSFAIFERAAKDVLRDADNAWTTGTYGNIAMALLPDNFATKRSNFLAAVKQMGSQAMLNALKEAKAAGVTLTPVSNLDVEALGASDSRLLAPQALEGEAIRKEVVFQLNFAKDALLGPKDLTRVDEFGRPYKTTADTLGLTEDTFTRHWKEIPPAIAEAWRNGELDALPTDDPLYAEAAGTLNQHINNWQTYQGDLDRATVGVLPTPPEGIDAAEWPDIWLELSVGERAAYRKKAKEGNQ